MRPKWLPAGRGAARGCLFATHESRCVQIAGLFLTALTMLAL